MTTKRINPIIAELDHEARHILKTTVFDLDGFEALPVGERAVRWRQFDQGAKFQCIALKLAKRFGSYDDATVEQWIAHYDAKWGVVVEAPAASDLPSLDAALLHETAAELARIAQFSEDRSAAGALNRAALHLANGVRAVLVAGDWLVPSASERGAVYRLTGQGCSCQAGSHGRQCWHAALVEITSIALERAAAAADDGKEEHTPAQLGRRLAEARRRYLAA